jgi:hypothetical protein
VSSARLPPAEAGLGLGTAPRNLTAGVSKEKKKLIREALDRETKLRDAALALAEQFKPPKYPASTITERQKARNTKYRKIFRDIVTSCERRISEAGERECLETSNFRFRIELYERQARP